MAINVKLLRKVKKHILEEPRRFQMNDVVYRGDPGEMFSDYGIDFKVPKCGTVACIAGWTNLLSNSLTPERVSSAEATLGITNWQGICLFLVSHWPEQFNERWYRAKRPSTRAKIAAERIEHFIKTKGAE